MDLRRGLLALSDLPKVSSEEGLACCGRPSECSNQGGAGLFGHLSVLRILPSKSKFRDWPVLTNSIPLRNRFARLQWIIDSGLGCEQLIASQARMNTSTVCLHFVAIRATVIGHDLREVIYG